MPVSSASSGRSLEQRQQPLIAPVPVDPVIVTYLQWAAGASGHGNAIHALDSGIERVRASAKAAEQSPDESPGDSVATPVEAIAMLDASRDALTQSIQMSSNARAALDSARNAVETALEQSEDLLVARRAIAVIAALLLPLLVWSFF